MSRAAVGSDDRARVLASLMPSTPWCIDVIRTEGSWVEIMGWAIAPGGDRSRVSFGLNGIPFSNIVYPLRREDLGQIFWYAPHAADCGFHCWTHASREDVFRTGFTTFSLLDKRAGRPFDDRHSYYFSDPLADSLPLPDAERRVRVHGGDSEITFRLEGYTHFIKLRLALRRIFGKDYEAFPRILDWGCGCGRLARHVRSGASRSYVGVDVDADNVGWCRANLPFGEFSVIPLRPPTQFPSGSFDLLIGVSIFTHLAEAEQDLWLRELHRLAADDAVLLMTVHGNAAVCRQTWDLSLLRYWLQHGFVAGPNPSLDAFLPETGYYQNSAHTESYLRRHWTKFFDIVEIIPGHIGNLQDLVVMRKLRTQDSPA